MSEVLHLDKDGDVLFVEIPAINKICDDECNKSANIMFDGGWFANYYCKEHADKHRETWGQ